MAPFFIARNEDFSINDGQWNGYTLILPCVSVGNVPQLTTDLLINSLLKTESHNSVGKDLELVGYIRSANLNPFAGPDPFTFHGQLFATSMQVFASSSKKLVIIQQRSPIFKERRNEFYAQLAEWVSKHDFSLIVTLSSSFDHYLVPGSNRENLFPMNHISANIDDNLRSFLEEKLGISAVKPVDPYTMEADPKGRIYLPGSGSARAYVKLFDTSIKQDKGPKVVCLVMYCSEGDNRLHAFKFADKVASLINFYETVFSPGSAKTPSGEEVAELSGQAHFDWTVPFSWRTLFGDEPPSEIF